MKGLAGSFNMVYGAAAALGAYFAVGAVKEAAKFESAMANVDTLLGRLHPQFQQLDDDVRRLALARPTQDLDKLTKGLYDIISATGDADNAMLALDITSKAATGGFADIAVVADGATSILNAYNMELTETEKVTDVMLKTVEVGKITMGELSAGIGMVTANAAGAEVAMSDLGAMIAIATRVQKPEQALVGLNMAMAQLPLRKEQLKEFGVEYTTFVDTLRQISELDLTPEDWNKIMPNIRASRTMRILTTQFGDLEVALEDFEDATGTTEAKFSIAMDTSAAKAAKLTAALNELKLTAGGTFLDAFANVYTVIEKAGGAIDDTTDKMPPMAQEILNVVLALGKWAAGWMWLPGIIAQTDDLTTALTRQYEIYDLLIKGTYDWKEAFTETMNAFREMVGLEVARPEQFMGGMTQARLDYMIATGQVSPSYTRALTARMHEEGRRRGEEMRGAWEADEGVGLGEVGETAGGAMADGFVSRLEEIRAGRDFGQTAAEDFMMAFEREMIEADISPLVEELPGLHELTDWEKFRLSLEGTTQAGVAGAFRAAITGGDWSGVLLSMMTDIVTQAFMASIGTRIAGGLTSLLSFIPFFQEGGYTGEYEGLAYLHKREWVFNEDMLNTMRSVGTLATQAAGAYKFNPKITHQYNPTINTPPVNILVSNADPTGIQATETTSKGSRVAAHYEA